MAPEVPIELLREILENIKDHETLYALVHTSRNFHVEAEPLLYRNVRLTRFFQVNQMLERVRQSQRIASAVRSLELVVGDYMINDEFLACVDRLIQQLSSLNTLTLGQSPTRNKIQLAMFYDNPPKLLLKNFSFSFRCDDQPLANFLTSQVALEHLELHDFNRRLPGAALPQLRSVYSAMKFALHLLPGRKITHMKTTDMLSESELGSLTPEQHDALHNISAFSTTLGPKQYLAVVNFVVKYMYNIEYLEIENPTLSIGAFHNFVTPLNLTRVRFVRFTRCLKQYNPRSLTIQTIFTRLPSLQALDFHAKDNTFHRWYRDAAQPVMITPTATRLGDAWHEDWERDCTTAY